MEDGFRRVLPADACTGKVPHPGDSGRSAGEAATGPHAPNRTVILNARSILSATWRITGLPLLAVTLEAGLRQGGAARSLCFVVRSRNAARMAFLFISMISSAEILSAAAVCSKQWDR
jgi:hypothetical protein